MKCVSCFWFAWKTNLFHELDPRRGTPPKPKAWVGLLVLIARCPYLESRVCPQIQNRGMEDVFELLMTKSQRYACWRWEGLSSLWQMSLSPLERRAPNKPDAVLLASCTGVWVRSHAFWKPVSLLCTAWFLRWRLLSELPASCNVLESLL